MTYTGAALLKPVMPQDQLQHVWASLKSWLCDDLDKVDHHVAVHLESCVPLLKQVTHYIVSASGKRLRPMMTLACARLLGYTGQDHIALAASIELIHTATLLHDDVIDDSPMRRGRPSAHLIWGQKVSILAGDFLFSQAFHLMMSQPHHEALHVLARATSSLAEGEVLQLETMNQLDRSVEDYVRVIAAKTASLFQAACHVAGIVGKGSASQQQALQDYGYHLGMIFQIRDDMLDYDIASDAASLTPGDDLKEGKVTLPILFCYQAASEADQHFLRQMFEKRDVSPQEWQNLLDTLRRYHVLDIIRAHAHTHVMACCEALRVFPLTTERRILEDLAYVLGQCQAV